MGHPKIGAGKGQQQVSSLHLRDETAKIPVEMTRYGWWEGILGYGCAREYGGWAVILTDG